MLEKAEHFAKSLSSAGPDFTAAPASRLLATSIRLCAHANDAPSGQFPRHLSFISHLLFHPTDG
jgi:hypothetical protein